MTVWDELVGQGPVVESLQDVIANPSSMTHAWLFTGPPGSGRSNAAKAFAAALQPLLLQAQVVVRADRIVEHEEWFSNVGKRAPRPDYPHRARGPE